MLKHTDRDMRSWKMARSKLAAMLPQEVLDEAVEARRREMIEEHMKENAEDAEDEDAVRARMFEDFENDRLEEALDDVSIWKHPGHDKRRDSWRKTLLGESETPLTPAVLAFYAKIFNDTIQLFLGEMHERIELRAQQEANEDHSGSLNFVHPQYKEMVKEEDDEGKREESVPMDTEDQM